MEKITLTLGEIITLEAELNGFIHPETGEKVVSGLLSHKLNLAKKYWLTKLADKCQSEKKIVDGLRDELVKKFGEQKDDKIEVKTFLDEERTQINPNYIEFQGEYMTLLSEKKELEYKPITLSDLESIDSEENYSIIFKLIKEDDGE
jgi:hypothetical protein